MPYKDPEVRKAYHRAYLAKHRERLSARRSVWYEKNKEGRRAYSRRWYAENTDRAREVAYHTRRASPWKYMLKAAQERAERKRVAFSLTLEWAEQRWTGKCEITGLAFDLTKRGCGPGPRSPTIDRIEASKGYVPGNCRFVLACVNGLKHGGTDDEMYKTAVAIVKSRPSQVLESTTSNTC